jgi:hypothetical protein
MKRSFHLFEAICVILSMILVSEVYSQNNTLAGFSSSTTYAEIPDGPAYDITGSITLEAWIFPTTWRAMHQGQVISKIEESSNSGYFLGVGDGGNIKFVFIDGSNFKVISTSSNPLTLNSWQHIASIYDGSKMYIYVNGQLITDGNYSGSIAPNNRPVGIGRANEDTDRYYVGKIDEVRIWNTAITGETIYTWYNNTLGTCHPNYANLVGYYECDDDNHSTTLQATVGTNGTVNTAYYESANNSSFFGSVTGFKSINAVQATTDDVPRGVLNNKILRLDVVTLGDNNLTQLVLRTDGTTNIADIENARIWATGTSNTFSTTTQFGSTIATPPASGTDMLFTGTYNMTGCNTYYFWLTYDIKSGATLNNVVDGKLQNATIQSVIRTPVISDPAGNRKIVELTYCNSNTGGSCQYITNVTYADINNTTGDSGGGGPVNYTSIVANVARGATNTISVTVNYCWSTPTLFAFIDWNRNGILNDAGEVYTIYTFPTSGNGPFTMNITVPSDAVLGNTRMRVMFQWNWSNPESDPCLSNGFWGEVEDYTVNISEGTTPIQLVSFKGYADKSANVLQWVTNSENNTDIFVIDRSENGSDWKAVAKVKAAGVSSSKINYIATDDQPLKKAYYRLRSLDLDGRFQISDVIVIERNITSFKLYSISPNPSDGEFSVTFNAPTNTKSRITLFNSFGTSVYSSEVYSKAGSNTEFINSNELINGIYTLLIEQNDQILTYRIVINK